MSKKYPLTSALTIRQRIEKAFAQKRKNDVYVSVHNNGTSDGEVFGFFLCDWDSPFDDFRSAKELDYRLDNESVSTKRLSLGFNYNRIRSES